MIYQRLFHYSLGDGAGRQGANALRPYQHETHVAAWIYHTLGADFATTLPLFRLSARSAVVSGEGVDWG